MPTVLRENGFRFFFWSNEGNEPAHIHITKGDGNAKYWLEPMICDFIKGFNQGEKRQIEQIITDNHQFLLNAWNER